MARTTRSASTVASVASLVRNAGEQPDAFGGRLRTGATMTYTQLDAALEDLARTLRGRGIGPGDLALIPCVRSVA